jgi:outer membrane receptor protein involved in Fe transport
VYGQGQLQLLNDTLRGVGGVCYDHYDDFGSQVTVSGSGSYLFQPTQTRGRRGDLDGGSAGISRKDSASP